MSWTEIAPYSLLGLGPIPTASTHQAHCLRPSRTRSLMGKEQDGVWGGQDQFLLSRGTKNLGL